MDPLNTPIIPWSIPTFRKSHLMTHEMIFKKNGWFHRVLRPKIDKCANVYQNWSMLKFWLSVQQPRTHGLYYFDVIDGSYIRFVSKANGLGSRLSVEPLTFWWPPVRPTDRWMVAKLAEPNLVTEKNWCAGCAGCARFPRNFQKTLKGPYPYEGIRRD